MKFYIICSVPKKFFIMREYVEVGESYIIALQIYVSLTYTWRPEVHQESMWFPLRYVSTLRFVGHDSYSGI